MATPTGRTWTRRVPGLVGDGLVRLHEVALIVVGLGFVFVADEDELAYLGIWDLLAVLYVGIGVVVLRRSRRDPRPVTDGPVVGRFRFNFLFALVASMIGFFVAVDIAVSDNPDEYQILLNLLGVVAMILSWMLLQAGYARRYASMYVRGGGLTFPSTADPSAVDFLYFSVTIGTAFSVSDVLVTTARMRWHVLVHSTISFFYNAAVVAFALSMFAGR
ncbi:DUF1345 domain-containing protein [Nakamurella multipartita]|uniref:DUF1345 domain-containing protein n=1 Tax=Nakamurella multipartita TaxID=53461 RepID=UPI00145F738D|nr:DUF1345 domain-containing protein [Nakamurella multipartita]